MPVGDWQFWVVTLVAVACVAGLVRQLLPKPKRARKTKVKLTIERKNGEQ